MTIKQSWAEMDKTAARKNGLAFLSKKFKTCKKPLKDVSELKDYLECMYTGAAQYDDPQEYPVSKACEGIHGASEGTDTLGRIFSGIVALRWENSCHDTCSEMVSSIGIEKNNTIFKQTIEYMNSCNKSYGVAPIPHWITTYYGSHGIRVVVKRFGSSLIFSNGFRDPYSSAGAGSHCLDIQPATEDDPEGLVMQRKIEVDMVHDWILKYSADLLQNQSIRLNWDCKISLFFFFLSSIFLIFMEQR
ncbi:hypothetical protein CUMW_164840 [Citrus unshiu]|uniref:Uncharacterized protein n=2 Tax=Citrus TaxID=2706 RepID=A0A2H5PTX7_CITUN|nr:hypothetical protein CUMW_164840 [Citrus unshiu]